MIWPGPEKAVLARQGLLDFDNQIGSRAYGFSLSCYAGSGQRIALIAKTAARSCIMLHQHAVACCNKASGTFGREPHAALIVFDLFENADDHDSASLAGL